MPEKQLSILLIAKNLASKTIGKVSKEIGGLGKMGRTAGRGLQSLAGNLAKIGAVAAVGIGAMVKQGLDSLATLESATSAVQGSITQMGLTGQLAAGQVATWANEIEASVGAAFDDKDILQAATTLLRFGKVTPKNLRPAMVVMTDLATKTGSVESAAALLAKALADPEKAAGKLARSGVILTKVQQEQIKAMVKAGKTAEAQAFLLEQLEKATKGAADASQGPYKRALSVLADVTEDAQRALAEGFLPVIERVAKWLSTKLADPKVIEDIRGLGKSLAGAFDKAVTFAQNIPWASIKDAMTLMGKGAKWALDAFMAMPPWVQTAVVSGWGLNKLTGGALGSIVGQLGAGLVKGVLGMTAGVVNAKAGVVNVVGGVGAGLPGAVATAAGGAAAFTAASAAAVIAILGSAAVVSWLSAQELVATTTLEERRKEGGLRAEQYKGSDAVMTGPAAPPPQLGPPVPPGLTNAKLQGTGSMMLNMPKVAGIFSRAVAKGLNPSVTALQKTLERNTTRTAIAERVRSLQQMFANLQLRAIAAKDFSPHVGFKLTVPVYLTSNVSVRNTVVRTALVARYTPVRT